MTDLTPIELPHGQAVALHALIEAARTHIAKHPGFGSSALLAAIREQQDIFRALDIVAITPITESSAPVSIALAMPHDAIVALALDGADLWSGRAMEYPMVELISALRAL